MSIPDRADLLRALPYARRYARALTGSQARGDEIVAESVKTLLEGGVADDPRGLRVRLYRWLTHRFNTLSDSGMPLSASDDGRLTTAQRQLLLLTSLEEFAVDDAASIVGMEGDDAASALADARAHIRALAATDVLIIEDEPIIAMDIEELVQSCGHRVVGVASSEAEAVQMAARTRPGLILADINLGLGGDGTSAVATILRDHYAPVIFVTAYPERLLTGNAIEPAYVITKPFEPTTLAIATYQAVNGGVRID